MIPAEGNWMAKWNADKTVFESVFPLCSWLFLLQWTTGCLNSMYFCFFFETLTASCSPGTCWTQPTFLCWLLSEIVIPRNCRNVHRFVCFKKQFMESDTFAKLIKMFNARQLLPQFVTISWWHKWYAFYHAAICSYEQIAGWQKACLLLWADSRVVKGISFMSSKL